MKAALQQSLWAERQAEPLQPLNSTTEPKALTWTPVKATTTHRVILAHDSDASPDCCS